MKNIIVGTAGHIDHGKTTLVKALTGIDADRLAEEKRRGITIDLGFAHLQLTPEIRLGFVDVPGHERFVRNMLAGAGGIDMVLFVVAADESIKPQTREHFDICGLLGIREGIIVITKSDLVPADLVDLVRLEMEEFVAGSFLEQAPMIPVSAADESGLDDLRAAMKEIAQRIQVKDASGPARLPIDRSFSMRGFGTVVTGTLVSGTIANEDELELLPARRSLRVRGLQAYGRSTNRAMAGARTAVNVADIEPGEVHRGMVLAEKGRFAPTKLVDVSVRLLKSAKKLKHRAPVHFHSGTAEIEAEVRLFHKDAVQPGAGSFARLRLKDAAVLAAGDRFILRQFSPVITIAGGTVVDVQPTRERRAAQVEARLAVMAGEDSSAKVALLVRESGAGVSAADLAARLGIKPEQALQFARQTEVTVIQPPGWAVGKAWMQRSRSDLLKAVEQHHAAAPLSPGISRQDLRARVMPDAPPFVFDAVLASAAELAAEGDRVRRRTHRVVLSEDEEQARRKIAQMFEQAGLAVPAVSEVLANAGVDLARGQTILRMLLKERVLIRISEELTVHQSAMRDLKALLASKKGESFTVSTFKEWTGVSRKYAVPLLEFLDREHATSRKGDLRVVSG